MARFSASKSSSGLLSCPQEEIPEQMAAQKQMIPNASESSCEVHLPQEESSLSRRFVTAQHITTHLMID